MSRLGRFVKGLGALGLLAALVVGIPWMLWHFIGWPLPHAVPDWGQLRRGLDQHGIPDQVLIKALASVVWVTWAVLVTSVVVEVPAALRGRSARQLRFVGVLQPITGRLVAAVVLAVVVLAPRPAQSTSPGSLRVFSPESRHRPVAAMVVNPVLADTTWTAPATTGPVASTAASPASRLPAASPQADSGGSTQTYVAERGDTLWGIAEHQLGDPLRWSEIFQMNAGHPQPDGRTLADPHWIDPGWILILPATTVPTLSVPASTPVAKATPGTLTPTGSAPTTAMNPGSSTAPDSPARSDPAPSVSVPQASDNPRAAAAQGANSPRAPVSLPSGSVVGGSFAAGVLSAVALGRLRRRHAYRYRAPEPGRDISPEPSRPTLRQLMRPFAADDDNDDDNGGDSGDIVVLSVPPFDDTECRQHPGAVDIGTQNGTTVTIEVTDLSGMAFIGSATDDIMRALLAAMLVRAGPGAAEVVGTTELLVRLLPGLGTVPAIRAVPGIDDVARIIEIEMVARTRRFEAVEASDASMFRAENPENPLPLLVALVDNVPDESRGRWIALLERSTPLGIAMLFVGASPLANGHLVTDESRKVTDVGRSNISDGLVRTVLFGLRPGEATELLGAVADSDSEGLSDDETPVDAVEEDTLESDSATRVLRADDHVEEASGSAAPADGHPPDRQWPDEHQLDENDHDDDPPRDLVVQVFGTYGITAYGEPVTTGLRSRAKALLAWYLLRPEGASIDEAVEALWPDTSAGQAHKPFWRALGELRTRFRGADVEALDVLTREGERYRLRSSEITSDLWEFQRALGAAVAADDDAVCRQALRRAVEVYAGDLLLGWDEPWIEVARQDLHRRCLDAHLRLAELEDHDGEFERAIATLEGAIDLDRYAEEPYRRIMRLQAAQGRPDTVKATWRLLQSRLGDLDLDVEDATAHLYRSLTVAGANPLHAPHPVRAGS
jgi:DNA-binding SARP family transcriptional activator/LysM repeat protein